MFETEKEKEAFASELPELLSNSYCPGDDDVVIVGEFVEYINEFEELIDPTDAIAIIAKCLACGVCARNIMNLSEPEFLKIPEISLELIKMAVLDPLKFSKLSENYDEDSYSSKSLKNLKGSFV